MNNSRPMSEREGAMFDALLAIGATVLEMGANPDRLREKLGSARAAAEALGNHLGAETIDFLIAGLFQPEQPPVKPTLRVV